MRRDVFKFIKDINYEKTHFTIPVIKDGIRSVSLYPITRNLKDHEVKLMAKWRAKNQHIFKDPNPITVEGTRKWFLDTHTDKRLLFLIESVVPIGHMGIYRIDMADDSLEIDNVIRGISQSKGIMHLALLAFVGWTKRVLNPKTIYLTVSKENIHAIEFYRKNHFLVGRETMFRDMPHYKMKYDPSTLQQGSGSC